MNLITQRKQPQHSRYHQYNQLFSVQKKKREIYMQGQMLVFFWIIILSFLLLHLNKSYSTTDFLYGAKNSRQRSQENILLPVLSKSKSNSLHKIWAPFAGHSKQPCDLQLRDCPAKFGSSTLELRTTYIRKCIQLDGNQRKVY